MTRLLDTLETGFNLMLQVLAVIVAISIAAFAILIPLNLLSIRLQMGGIWWLYEAIEYTLFVGIFLCAPWVLQQGAHVRVDVFVAALPRQAAIRLEQIMDAAGAALCVVLCYYGVRATLSEFMAGTLPDKDLRIDNWIMLSVFSISFLLLAIEFLFRLRRARERAETQQAKTGL